MRTHLLLISTLIGLLSHAQKNQRQAPWQQQANYSIDVTLNDRSNVLTGFETIEYFNNSPVALSEIYIHLYPNAYKNTGTAFAREKAEGGDKTFWKADSSMRGFIDGLQFTVDNEPVTLKMSTVNIDNAKLILTKPVPSKGHVTIRTPFYVKIPYTFSRLGHTGHAYQISQWFPKIAVYDVNGWNQFPYLDQGEFYSDFGDYDVRITLPKNYLVAATGNLQNEDELLWMQQRAGSQTKDTAAFPPDAMKTLRFTEQHIHDFAWFADKNWCLAMKTITLPDKNFVQLFAFDSSYSNAEKGIAYMKYSVLFLSESVGSYPYKTVKACTGALKAGAGMEYPTVTVVEGMIDNDVVHEVGHNWFYGILGSNERRYPFMDEGINTFYQLQIVEEPAGSRMIKPIQRIFGDNFTYSERNLWWLTGTLQSSRGADQVISNPATEFSSINYGALVYYRTAKNFLYLKGYLGDSLFNACMKNYYEKWKFRHPLPGDLQDCFEEVCGKNLNWFFEGYIKSPQLYDFSIRKVRLEDHEKEVEIKLRNNSSQPLAVKVTLSGRQTGARHVWVDPFKGDTIIHVANDRYTLIETNAGNEVEEVCTTNNFSYPLKKFPSCRPVQFRFGTGLDNKYRKTVYFVPAPAYNRYNKFMLGVAFYNSAFIRKKTEFMLLPLYSFSQKNINGYAVLQHTFLPRGTVNTWVVGATAAHFNSRYYGMSPIAFTRIRPFVELNFRNPHQASKLERSLRFDFTQVMESKTATSDTLFSDSQHRYLNVEYLHARNTVFNAYSFRVRLEKNLGDKVNDYFKVLVNGRYILNYDDPNKYLCIDVFAGKMSYSRTDGKGMYNIYLAAEGPYSDYKYWNTFIDRDPGLSAHRMLSEQGGIRSNVTAFAFDNLGMSVRLRTHLPFTSLLRPYVDMGTYRGMQKDIQSKYFYVSGISLVIWQDVLEVNFPLAFTHKVNEIGGGKRNEVIHAMQFTQSKTITSIMNNSNLNYLSTITFLVNLNKLNPWDLMHTFSLGK